MISIYTKCNSRVLLQINFKWIKNRKYMRFNIHGPNKIKKTCKNFLLHNFVI